MNIKRQLYTDFYLNMKLYHEKHRQTWFVKVKTFLNNIFK